MDKCPQSESQIQNKVQLISLDFYGFWGTYFLVNTLTYLKIFFINLIIFSGRAGHGVKCKMDFLDFLKILYSYNRFKIGIKGIRGSYMNNR